MCGICGHVRLPFLPEGAGQQLEPVLAGIAHRGPDALGRWECPQAALSHARLSILDLDPRAGQPMVDPASGNVIVFNGEIYNFRALRAELEKAGESFRTTGDTEVLLKLYRLHGQGCLDLLRGMYAFAIWDAARQELFLARDRVGKKPLVYFEGANGLVFSSEIGSLSAHADAPSDMDPEALDLFLSLGYVPSPRTIYAGMRKLPPGWCGVYGKNGLRLRRYWQADYRTKISISEEEALDLAWAELKESVRLRLESDVPLGLLLSGGVDSSLVAAVLAEVSPGQARAFSIGFGEEKYDELPHARRVADHLGLSLTHEVLPPASLEILPEVAALYGEPFADDSALPSLFLCRMARRHITVALGGDGGDELALGYPTYRHAKLATALCSLSPLTPPGDDALRGLTAATGALGKIWRDFASGLLWPETKPLLRAEASMRPLKARLYTAEAARQLSATYAGWFLPWLRESYQRAVNPQERMLYIDNSTCLPDDLLVKMDIASMEPALEVRSPLLDHKLIELFASFPPALKVRRGETKHLLKKLAERKVPREVLYRRKQGFDLPIREWMAGPMRPFVREALSQASADLARFIRPEAALALADEHAQGKNRKNILWRLVILSLWSARQKGARS